MRGSGRAASWLASALPAWPLLVLACAGRSTPAPPDARAFPHDSARVAGLVMEPGPAQADALVAYESARALDARDTLALITESPGLHALVRANALLLLGRREPDRHLLLVGMALEDADERVQLAAVAVLRELLDVKPAVAMPMLGGALASTSVGVQARVLETVAARDVDMLRRYVRRGPSPELLRIATDLIAVAEERGARLEPADSTGALARTGPAGHVLRYIPVRCWSGGVSAGPLTLRPREGANILLGEVEVAGSVIPAFFSADGGFLVFESGRAIHVRDVTSGITRMAGPGIAPRVLPFTEDFVFLREIAGARTELRGGTRIQYEVLRAPFAPAPDTAPPHIVSGLGANPRMSLHANASPVRWMRVAELRDGAFALVGESMDTTLLPDPFAPGSSPD